MKRKKGIEDTGGRVCVRETERERLLSQTYTIQLMTALLLADTLYCRAHVTWG